MHGHKPCVPKALVYVPDRIAAPGVLQHHVDLEGVLQVQTSVPLPWCQGRVHAHMCTGLNGPEKQDRLAQEQTLKHTCLCPASAPLVI